jgi:hypothetical protein
MYRHEMEKQTSSVKNVKTLMLPELSDDNKILLSPPQVQAYNRLTPDKSMPTPDRSIARQVNANAGQQAPAALATLQQRRQDDPPRANRLHARDLLRDFERDGLEVYNSPQLTWELLFPL